MGMRSNTHSLKSGGVFITILGRLHSERLRQRSPTLVSVRCPRSVVRRSLLPQAQNQFCYLRLKPTTTPAGRTKGPSRGYKSQR